jgi:hypothetical protein
MDARQWHQDCGTGTLSMESVTSGFTCLTSLFLVSQHFCRRFVCEEELSFLTIQPVLARASMLKCGMECSGVGLLSFDVSAPWRASLTEVGLTTGAVGQRAAGKEDRSKCFEASSSMKEDIGVGDPGNGHQDIANAAVFNDDIGENVRLR